jgi:hypothetical protein
MATLPTGLALASGVYTLSTGIVAGAGAGAPRGTYTMDVEVLYIDGELSEAFSASAASPAFSAFTSQVGVGVRGTATMSEVGEAGTLPLPL